MKTSCEIVKDLLPLYHDKVCSTESGILIEEHLKECPSCTALLAAIADEIAYPKKVIDETKPIKAIKTAWKKSKKKSFVMGTIIAVLVCTVLVGAYFILTQRYIITIPTDLMEISEVSIMSDGRIIFDLTLHSDKDMQVMSFRYIDGSLYMSPRRAVIDWHHNYSFSSVGRYQWAEAYQLENVTALYLGTPNDRMLIWEEGMELPAASEWIENMFSITDEGD